MNRIVGLFVDGFHAKRVQFLAYPPRHRPRQITDHRRLLVNSIWEHSDFIAVVQKPGVTFGSEECCRTVTKREGILSLITD